MPQRILVVAPHPDDETLGCGGTLLKHKHCGDETYWLIMTSMKDGQGWDHECIRQRHREIEEVANHYQFSDTIKLDYPTTELDAVPQRDMIAKISQVVQHLKPQVVYLPFWNDVHTDHQITFNACFSALKSFRYPDIKRILAYETLSETEFSVGGPGNSFFPDVFSEITTYIENKKKIFRLYSDEIMASNYPRSLSSIEALASLRGSRVCRQYCEAFMLVLEVN